MEKKLDIILIMVKLVIHQNTKMEKRMDMKLAIIPMDQEFLLDYTEMELKVNGEII